MAKTQMWMVRASENGYLFDDFKNGKFVAIGWNDLGSLSGVDSPNEIRKLYQANRPGEHTSKANNAVAMIYKFVAVLKPGQRVITYNPIARE